jgi:hypothetical protein
VQPGDLLHPIGVCDEVLYVPGRTRVQQIIPVGEDRALPQETLAQRGPWRLRPRPAPQRSSAASREPISRSTALCRRDLAAADLPAEAGPAGPSRQRRPPSPLDRRAVHLPAGRILRSRSASHPGRTARRADSPVPGTQAPRPYPQAPHSLLTKNPGSTIASRHRRVRTDEALRVGARNSKPQLSAASARVAAEKQEAEFR